MGNAAGNSPRPGLLGLSKRLVSDVQLGRAFLHFFASSVSFARTAWYKRACVDRDRRLGCNADDQTLVPFGEPCPLRRTKNNRPALRPSD